MRLGYNTNGLAHHRLLDAIALLAEEGYESVALTLDAGALDPYEAPPALALQVDAAADVWRDVAVMAGFVVAAIALGAATLRRRTP